MWLKPFIFLSLIVFSTLLPATEIGLLKPLSQIAEHPRRAAPATAVSINNSTLSAEIQAQVQKILVGVSEPVVKDQLLLQLDCTDYGLASELAHAGVEAAQARLTLARSQRDRSNSLLKRDLVSQESADTAVTEALASQAQLDQAKLAVKQAQVDVARCSIKAPFDGVIVERIANEGQLAAVGTPLLSITETARMELSAQVNPDEVEQLEKAESLTFSTVDNTYAVELLRVGGTVNTATGDQEVRLSFIDHKPPPGTAGQLQWRDPRWFVPASIVVKRDGKLGVFINRDGKAAFIPLPHAKPGRINWVALPPHTQIVVSNLGQMQEGQSL